MLFGCAGVLMAAAGAFATEVPPLLRARLEATNETHGAFTQVKRLPTGEAFASRGEWRVRPGVDFAWRTTEPFDSLFWADLSHYVYSNEDECVEKPLKKLPYLGSRVGGLGSDGATGRAGEAFFRAFDALYKEEEGGVFHVLAKPREARLAKFLSRVEADGTVSNWVLRATFPDRTTFEIRLRDAD